MRPCRWCWSFRRLCCHAAWTQGALTFIIFLYVKKQTNQYGERRYTPSKDCEKRMAVNMKESLWCLQKKTQATLKNQLWSFLLYIYNFFELDRSTSLFSWNTSQPRIVYPDARATSIECAELIKTPIFFKCAHLFVHTCVYNPTSVPRTQWCIPSWRIIPVFTQALFLKEV